MWTILMNQAPSPSSAAAVDKLKEDWDQLSVPDRALAVGKIRRSGFSIRQIARLIGRSESSLRYHLKTLHAPTADLAAARKRKISLYVFDLRRSCRKGRKPFGCVGYPRVRKAVQQCFGCDHGLGSKSR
jgi:hypothetical protein